MPTRYFMQSVPFCDRYRLPRSQNGPPAASGSTLCQDVCTSVWSVTLDGS